MPGVSTPMKRLIAIRKIQLRNCARIPGRSRFHRTIASPAPMTPKIAPDAPALKLAWEYERDVADPRTPAPRYSMK